MTSRTLPPILVVALALAVTAFAPSLASAAGPKSGPCLVGQAQPTCKFQYGKVDFIADGDTIRVKVDGIRPIQNVRFVGINAMELSRYSKYPGRRRGECHGLQATTLIERYIKRSGGRVRLAAQSLSSRTGRRKYRSVAVRIGGGWRDLGQIVMEAGLALWLPQDAEWAHNDQYHRLAEQARATGRGMYDPDVCGAGPDQDVPLEVSVNWDAEGDDAGNVNGEWVDVFNRGTRPVSLAGWWIRDSFLRRDGKGTTPAGTGIPGYTVPAGTVVPAGGALRLRAGNGSGSALEQFWGLGATPFENISYDRRGAGDGAYLFDPQGDLRASAIYGCLVSCDDPRIGQLELDVAPDGPESVSLRNVSAGPVDLSGLILKEHNGGRSDSFSSAFNFGANSVVPAGQTLLLELGQQGRRPLPQADVVRSWRENTLADGGGVMSLRTSSDIVVACDDWGSFSC